jgi:acyl-[acyl-carrier-protein]-phospholipid O-acyltransferase/long-chain-fatty-acid--[acyl-carrier-protein] ligase
MFWLIGGVVQPFVNSLGKVQFRVSDTSTSLLAACMGVGIAVGCLLAGWFSRQRVNFTLMRIGAWMVVVLLVLIAIPGRAPNNLLGYSGTLPALVLLGAAAGFFAVPLQVFLQTRPPQAVKGRTIATMNLANWIAIIVSAGVYWFFDIVLSKFDWPRAAGFALTALVMLPVAIFYRPKVEDGAAAA